MTKLPNKLSDCIDVAIKDLSAVERSKKYVVVMNSTWHTPEFRDTRACGVCFAGAVMAKSLGASVKEERDVDSFDKHTRNRLSALDHIRQGTIGMALDRVHGGTFTYERPFGLSYSVDVAPYEDDPKQFKKDMGRVANLLRKFGE